MSRLKFMKDLNLKLESLIPRILGLNVICAFLTAKLIFSIYILGRTSLDNIKFELNKNIWVGIYKNMKHNVQIQSYIRVNIKYYAKYIVNV